MLLYFYMQVMGNFQSALLGNFHPVLTPRIANTVGALQLGGELDDGPGPGSGRAEQALQGGRKPVGGVVRQRYIPAGFPVMQQKFIEVQCLHGGTTTQRALSARRRRVTCARKWPLQVALPCPSLRTSATVLNIASF